MIVNGDLPLNGVEGTFKYGGCKECKVHFLYSFLNKGLFEI